MVMASFYSLGFLKPKGISLSFWFSYYYIYFVLGFFKELRKLFKGIFSLQFYRRAMTNIKNKKKNPVWKRLEKLLSLKRQLTEVFSHIRGCCREDKVDRLGSDGFTGQ